MMAPVNKLISSNLRVNFQCKEDITWELGLINELNNSNLGRVWLFKSLFGIFQSLLRLISYLNKLNLNIIFKITKWNGKEYITKRTILVLVSSIFEKKQLTWLNLFTIKFLINYFIKYLFLWKKENFII